jgi:hypothetical protein
MTFLKKLEPLTVASLRFTLSRFHTAWNSPSRMHDQGSRGLIDRPGFLAETPKVGLARLRTAWFNLDWLWAGALVVTGAVILLS